MSKAVDSSDSARIALISAIDEVEVIRIIAHAGLSALACMRVEDALAIIRTALDERRADLGMGCSRQAAA